MKRREHISVVFGRRLRHLRQSRGMTQEELAHAVGIGYKHLGEIERGDAAPSFDVIERLAKALDVEYAVFFLADTLGAAEVRGELERLAERADHVDSNTIRIFFDDLLQAVRKIDHGRRGSRS